MFMAIRDSDVYWYMFNPDIVGGDGHTEFPLIVELEFLVNDTCANSIFLLY